MTIWENDDINDLPEEEWRDITGKEGLYQVSNLGRMKTLARDTRCGAKGIQHRPERVLRQTENPYGYLITSGGFVHRCVASAFIPNPNGYREVNHINGDKKDNRVENLEWCSRSQNMKHAYVTGLKHANHSFLIAGRKKRAIQQKDINTGAVVARYSSVLEAAKTLGKDQGHITRAALGQHKTAYGFRWEYVDNDE